MMTVGTMEDRLAALEAPVKPERNSELIFYLSCIALATGAFIWGELDAAGWIEMSKWLAIAYGAGRVIKKTVSKANGKK